MSPTSRFWLVELSESAHADSSRRAEVWGKIHEIGDLSTTDMAVVSFATLEELMAPTDPEIVRLWRKQRRAHAAHLPAGA